MKYSTRFSFRIYAGKEPYLGPGRVQLMEGIIAYGSISKAAEEMGMSYRKAWQLVRDINEVSPKPLVEKRLGGKAGGGAIVTNAGVIAINNYYKLQKKAEQFFARASAEFKV